MWWRDWAAFCCALLTSVVPPGAKSKTIHPKMIGKVPGYKKADGFWVGIAEPLTTRTMTIAEAKQASHDGATIGLMSRDFPGNDNDVNDHVLAKEIDAYFAEELGPAPVRTVGDRPHSLRMYAGGPVYIRKKRLAFRLPGDAPDAKPHAVELLGYGQYYNVEGFHPCGLRYQWTSPHPCELGPFNLTVITPEQVEDVYGRLPGVFGLTLLPGSGSGGKLTSARRTKLGDPSKLAPSAEHVLQLLHEYRPAELGHDDFVRHLSAIKGALGTDAEEYYPDVLEWAPGVRSTEEEATRKRWDSITDIALGWQWLVDKSGTKLQAQDDFNEPVPADSYAPDPAELAIKQMVQGWIFSDSGFHEESTGRVVSKDLFNAQHTHVIPYGLTGRKTATALFQNDKRARKANMTVYRPAAPVFIASEKAVNLWRPSPLIPVHGTEPAQWLDLCHFLMPNDAVREHVLSFFAHLLQHPGQKIGHAPTFFSTSQGVGKDTMMAPILRAIGPGNFIKLAPQHLKNRFNTWLEHVLIYISEMRDFERNAIYLAIKPHIAIEEGPPQIEAKGVSLRGGYKEQNFIFSTNHGNAVGIDEEDRRVMVEKMTVRPKPDAYYDSLWNSINAGLDAIVMGWLLNRDISTFNRFAPAPMTAAKLEMIDAVMSPARRWLREQFSEGGLFHGRALLTFAEIADANEWGIESMHHGHVMAALTQYGYFAIEGKHRIGGSLPTRVWTNDVRLASLSGEFLAAAIAKDRKKS